MRQIALLTLGLSFLVPSRTAAQQPTAVGSGDTVRVTFLQPGLDRLEGRVVRSVAD